MVNKATGVQSETDEMVGSDNTSRLDGESNLSCPGGSYQAVSPLATDSWCRSNCAAGYCPASMCACSSGGTCASPARCKACDQCLKDHASQYRMSCEKSHNGGCPTGATIAWCQQIIVHTVTTCAWSALGATVPPVEMEGCTMCLLCNHPNTCNSWKSDQVCQTYAGRSSCVQAASQLLSAKSEVADSGTESFNETLPSDPKRAELLNTRASLDHDIATFDQSASMKNGIC